MRTRGRPTPTTSRTGQSRAVSVRMNPEPLTELHAAATARHAPSAEHLHAFRTLLIDAGGARSGHAHLGPEHPSHLWSAVTAVAGEDCLVDGCAGVRGSPAAEPLPVPVGCGAGGWSGEVEEGGRGWR